jgi:hypothetical protein
MRWHELLPGFQAMYTLRQKNTQRNTLLPRHSVAVTANSQPTTAQKRSLDVISDLVAQTRYYRGWRWRL